jgi:hypothetical protein
VINRVTQVLSWLFLKRFNLSRNVEENMVEMLLTPPVEGLLPPGPDEPYAH